MKRSRYMYFYGFVFVSAIILLSACNYLLNQANPIGINENVMGMNIGHGSDMMSRHHADIPNIYAGKVSPINNDEKSIERGRVIY